MRAADWIVDVGPGAGVHGGNIVYSGPAADIVNCEVLRDRRSISVRPQTHPCSRRPAGGDRAGCSPFWTPRKTICKNIDVSFRLGVFNCVTGVSGSGKSSLVNEILYKQLAGSLNRAHTCRRCAHAPSRALKHLDKVI